MRQQMSSFHVLHPIWRPVLGGCEDNFAEQSAPGHSERFPLRMRCEGLAAIQTELAPSLQAHWPALPAEPRW